MHKHFYHDLFTSTFLALQLLKTSAQYDFPNSTQSLMLGSNSALAYFKAPSHFNASSYFNASSTNSTFLSTVSVSAVPSSAQVPEPALISTTGIPGAANPQSKVPDLLPATSTTAFGVSPKQPIAGQPPVQSTSPAASPGPAVSPITAPSQPPLSIPATTTKQVPENTPPEADSSKGQTTPNRNTQPANSPYLLSKAQSTSQLISGPTDTLPVYTLSANGNTFLLTSGPSSGYIINSQTLSSGGTVTVNGIPISLPTLGSSIVIGSNTIALSSGGSSPKTPPAGGALGFITIANALVPYQTSASALMFEAGQTLTPGGSVSVNGVPVSLPQVGSSIIIGGSTVSLGHSSLPITAPPAPPLIIQGQTLTPGGVITISKVPISLHTSGSAFIVGGSSTIPLSALQTISVGSHAVIISQATAPSNNIPGLIAIEPGTQAVVDGVTVSIPTKATAIDIDGSTIAPGSEAVINGATVSIPSQATDLVIGSSTIVGIGGVIFSALTHIPSPPTPVKGGIGAPAGGSNATVAPYNLTSVASPSLLSSVSAFQGLRKWWVGLMMVFGYVYASILA